MMVTRQRNEPPANRTNTMKYDQITKEQALDILIDRIKAKFPGVDAAKERAILAKQSRESLIHSVGAQWYGDTSKVDREMCDYAYSQMTPADQRGIDQAG